MAQPSGRREEEIKMNFIFLSAAERDAAGTWYLFVTHSNHEKQK